VPEPVLPDLVRLHELLRIHLDRAIREAGLAQSESVVLASLAKTSGLTGADLARKARVTPQSMHGTLVRLQRDGRIESGPHPSDKRLRVFTLTRAGRAATRAAMRGAVEIEARLTHGLTDGERLRLASAARECADALEVVGRPVPGSEERPEA
jgi:DNA-binding MarR family transcriptional regulator